MKNARYLIQVFLKVVLVSFVLVLVKVDAFAQGTLIVSGPSTACVGTSATFIAQGPSCIQYQWTVVNGVTQVFNGSTATIFFNVAGTIQIQVRGLCNGGSTNLVTVKNVTVSPQISTNVLLDAAPTACQGTNINLAATGTNGGTTPTYTFYVDNVQVATGASSIYAVATTGMTPGNHTAYVKMTSSLTGCINPISTSATKTFVVNSITPYTVQIKGPDQICSSPSSISMTASVVGGTGNLTYEWFVNGISQGAPSASSTYAISSPATGQNVWCKSYTDNPCVVSPVQSNTYVIPSMSSGATTLSIYLDKTAFCNGETMNLTSGVTAASYSWKLNGTQFSTSASTSLPVNTDVNAVNTFSPGDIVTLDAVSITGATCSSNGTGTLSSSSITINSSVVPSVTLTNIGAQVCNPTTVTLTANPVNGGASPTYVFFLDGAQVYSGPLSNYSAGQLPNGSHSAYVTMTSNSPCRTVNSATSPTINFTVSTSLTYTAQLTGPTSLCNNSNTNIDFSVSTTPASGLGNLSYQWFYNNTPVAPPSSTATYRFSAINNGDQIYAKVLSDYSGCIIQPVSTTTRTMSVTNIVTPTANIIPTSTTVCEGNSITFNATGSNTSGSTYYTWVLNGNPLSEHGSSVTIPAQPGAMQNGTYYRGSTLTVTESNLTGSCIAPTANYTYQPNQITINPKPATPVISDKQIALNATNVVLNVAGGLTCNWYDSNGSYITQAANYTITGPVTQHNSYSTAQVVAGCESARVPFRVIVSQLPTVDAGPDLTIAPRASLTLYGNGSDAEGTITSFTWTQTSGPALVRYQNFNIYTLQNIGVGTYTFKLRATDNSGNYSEDNCTVVVSNVANNYSYVREDIANIPFQNISQINAADVPNKTSVVSYNDILGRPSQTVSIKASPLSNDILSAYQYDDLGRARKNFLPMRVFQGTGNYVDGVLWSDPYPPNSNYVNSPHYNFYNSAGDNIPDDTAPYSDVQFEASPLGRIIRQGSVGAAYQPSTHYSSKTYSSAVAGDVRKYTIVGNQPQSTTTYDGSSLAISSITDEQLVESQTITDLEGQIIVKRTKIDDTNWATTQYVYDTRNRLRFILTPELMRAMKTAGNYTPTQSQLNIWAWQYVYDSYDRVVETRAPGNDTKDTWVYTVYDSRDRVVLSQTGEQRAITQWTFSKYDAMDRPVVTGIYTHYPAIISRVDMQAVVDALSAGAGYQNIDISPSTIFPVGSNAVSQAITFYDDYSNCSICADPRFQFTPETWTTTSGAEPFQKADRVRGQVVGQMTKVLGSPTSQWIYTVNYYNKYMQKIQSFRADHINGVMRSSSLVDFTGKTLESLTSTSGLPGVTKVRRRMQYDQAGRITAAYHKVNDQREVLLAYHQYNELGQLVDKSLHDATLQSVDYRYNVRGGIASINTVTATEAMEPEDLFAIEVGYDREFVQGAGKLNTGRFDGAISGTTWRNTLPSLTYPFKVRQKGYSYSYNKMGWITSSLYKENTFTDGASAWNQSLAMYDEKVTGYDYNGNITDLDRNARSIVSGGTPTADNVDHLHYTYTTGAVGNQLTKVAEQSASINKDIGFKDAANTDDDYEYNLNNSLTKDKNKRISSITYTFNNCIDRITFDDNSYVHYWYDAAGDKLRQEIYNTAGTLVDKTDYVGSVTVVNDQLKYIDHEEGRLVNPDNTNLVANGLNDASSLSGFQSSSATLSTYFNGTSGQTYIKSVSQVSVGNPGITDIGGFYQVQQGESYTFKILGYQEIGTSAKLSVTSPAGDILWSSSPALPVGAANENYVTGSFTVPAGATYITLGVKWAAPTAGNTFYVNEVKLYKSDLEYQYFLEDHQGTPRVVLGTNPNTTTFIATMETENFSKENPLWMNLAQGQYTAPPDFGANATPGGDQSMRLDASFRVGPAKSLKVFTGDIINASVSAYYNLGSGLTQAASGVVSGALTAAIHVAGTIVDGAISTAYTAANPAFSPAMFQGSTKPSAFINYILFDANYTVLEAKATPLGTAGVKSVMSLPQINVREPGYLLVYLSYDNEGVGAPVFFDEFKVVYQESPVIQMNEYYPFGMVASEWVRDGEIDNNNLFQGKEYIDKTGWQDFGSRMYAGDVGRWFASDPSQQFSSPYSAMGNSPAMYVDPDGEFINVIIGAVIGGGSAFVAGKKAGLHGFDLFIATALGTGIGALSSGVGTGVAASIIEAGGSAVVAGAAGGAAGGAVAGFFGAGMNNQNPLEGGWKGATAGLAGGGLGSAFSGGASAFIGGAATGATTSALNHDGHIFRSSVVGGAVAFAAYQASALVKFSTKTGDEVFDKATFKQKYQWSRMEQQTLARDYERGIAYNNDGTDTGIIRDHEILLDQNVRKTGIFRKPNSLKFKFHKWVVDDIYNRNEVTIPYDDGKVIMDAHTHLGVGSTRFSTRAEMGDLGVFEEHNIKTGVMFNGTEIHTYSAGKVNPPIQNTNRYLMRTVFGF